MIFTIGKHPRRLKCALMVIREALYEVTKNIMDCNFYHYSLQMSLYSYILEKYYNIKINNNHIVHLKDDGVKAISTPYMKNEIIAMLNHEKI